jgi:CRISPR-associated exonuclease Cas4
VQETNDPELVMISALEHWSYCPRQCALIHVEQTYSENTYTVRGNYAHERAHDGGRQTSQDVRVLRGIPLWSDKLGLIGKSDVVELRKDGPYPLEYKVGKRGKWGHAEIQLGAQALCLEEMLSVPVPEGSIVFRGSNTRQIVAIDEELRTAVVSAINAVRVMLSTQIMPEPLNDARCPKCSLIDACLPGVAARPQRLRLLDTLLFKPEAVGG